MLDGVPHQRGRQSGALIPDGGLAALECEVTERVQAGDHLLVIATVRHVAVPGRIGRAADQVRGPVPGPSPAAAPTGAPTRRAGPAAPDAARPQARRVRPRRPGASDARCYADPGLPDDRDIRPASAHRRTTAARTPR